MVRGVRRRLQGRSGRAGKGYAQCDLQEATLKPDASAAPDAPQDGVGKGDLQQADTGMHVETTGFIEGLCMPIDTPQWNEQKYDEETFELFWAKIGYLGTRGTQKLHNKYQARASTQYLGVSGLHSDSKTKMSTAAQNRNLANNATTETRSESTAAEITKDEDNATAEKGGESTCDPAPKRAKIKHKDFRGRRILIAEQGAVISDHNNFYVPRNLKGRTQFMHLLTREIYDEIPPGVVREPATGKGMWLDTGVDFKVEPETGMATWEQAWPGDMRPSGCKEARLIFRMGVSNPWKKDRNPLLAQFGMVTVSTSARKEEPLGSFGILLSSDGGVKLCKPSDGKGHATSIANEAGGPPRLRISWAVPVAAESADLGMLTGESRRPEGYRIEIDIAMLEHAASHALGLMDRRFPEPESAGKMAYYNEVCHVNQQVRDFISNA